MRALLPLLASVAVVAAAGAGAAHADTVPVEAVAIAASEPMTLDQFASALRAATNRPVLIGLSAERAFLRDDKGHRLKVRWNGDLAALLDAVAPRFGVQWAIENDAVLLFDAASARPKAPAAAPKPQPVTAAPVAAPTPIAAPAAAPLMPMAAPAMAAPMVAAAPAHAPIAAAPSPAPAPIAAPSRPLAAPIAAPVRDPAVLDLAQFLHTAAEDAPAEAAPAAARPRAVGRRPSPIGANAAASGADLDTKEAFGVELANRWKANPDKPRQGEDGSVKYLYGATLPTLVCSPLEVCAIQLQPGEVVNDVHAGDTARWRITPANSGAGEGATTLVIVKPVDAGLTTNLFISTDRRVYSIKLVSSRTAWMPLMSFDYPDDVKREWQGFRQRQQQQAKREAEATLPTAEPVGQNVASLDFGFRVTGDQPRWAPTRVYSDGLKTYIQFPNAQFADEAPALVELGRGSSTQMVNYRVVGDRYVVDHVIDRAALIAGVGKEQTRVVIEHKGERR